MIDEDRFVELSALICEPVRARMLWNLLDGKAYTAGELSIVADVSATNASNHLSKMVEAGLLKVESQGRHRYFSFARAEVAYAVESLANLVGDGEKRAKTNDARMDSIKYCRTCYDHLAGYVSIQITQAMEKYAYLQKLNGEFIITPKGWKWLEDWGIRKEMFERSRRPIARQCLDWSERKPHIAGLLGAFMLEKMLEKKWFRKKPHSRELLVTPRGLKEIKDRFKVSL